MDMQLNAEWIRSERERRAMSQEQLAAAAGLGTRTIQRVEKSGMASFETTKAIASVLETDIAQLTAIPMKGRRLLWRSGAVISLFAAAAVIGLVWTRSAHAGQVMLDVDWAINDDRLTKSLLITDDGQEAEIGVDRRMRAVFSPSPQANKKVLLQMQLYTFDGNAYVLILSDQVVVDDNTATVIKTTNDDGSRFHLVITPHELRN